MTDTIESICYEYSEDCLFSQQLAFSGAPVMLICYVERKYITELSRFLSNHKYEVASEKKMGKYFCLVRFELTSINSIDL